ncbi:MAG: hypothetical protein F6K55_03400 [Moorea sp. SIO4A3]|nr:hypothetical protein [Moorena sp. SIO4A3]
MSNRKVLTNLPRVTSSAPAWAKLSRIDNLESWVFLYMPDQIQERTTFSYRDSGGMGYIPNQILDRGSKELTINNLTISTKYERRSLQDYARSLENLGKPIPQLYSPPVLILTWGDRVLFKYCVLTSVQVTQQDWFSNGDLATATLSFSLKEVPKDQVVKI